MTPSLPHRIGLEDRKQESTYEMGQIVLELLHVWPPVGLWVSQGFRFHLPSLAFTYFLLTKAPLEPNAPISLRVTAALTILQKIRGNVGHRSSTLVPTKCTRSDSDDLGRVLSCWTRHDSPQRFRSLRQQCHGTLPDSFPWTSRSLMVRSLCSQPFCRTILARQSGQHSGHLLFG